MAGTLVPTAALSDALVILGAAGIVIPAFARLRITPIIGFILVGLAVGPYGLGAMVPQVPWLYHITISDPHAIEPFAEFGIILLLFEIGLELSFNRLWQMRRLVFGLGAMELAVSAALLAGALLATGESTAGALGLGLALALSSTALVLPISGTQGPVGRAALSMLLFEDIALVPIIFLLGALGPASAEGGPSLLSTLLEGGAVVVALLVAGKLLLPRLFAQAAQTKSPELFLAASLLVVIVAALATGGVGLSPIMGALLAGLLIAETEYHTEVEAITKPFKGLALGVFLITIGMGIDLRLVWQNAGSLAIAVTGVVLLKAIVTGLSLRLMGKERSTALQTGILMASPSETTLIVLATAAQARLIDADTAQFWQIVTAIGLTITPLLAKLGEMSGRRLGKAEGRAADADIEPPEGDRAVILGFGRVGRLVGDMLKVHGTPFVAIDSDPAMVRAGREAGMPVLFGNIESSSAFERLDLDHARALILTMDEPVLASRIVRRLRAERPDVPIIVRARDAEHAAELYRAGASHAVPETLESSLQLSEAVLVDLGVPMGPVIASIHEKRDEFRKQIMEEGELDSLPRLKSSRLRERQT
ncbi:cation:proton antiporter domain-containing protein [Novosphingobium cyanobacteriorum]|uniref:Cation:proton antiporter n=1 Tax=Novosphingobium cyanobacteriorum TaxID=3024215 RepID=A0ABT6CI22_9SPHN|nr:cation:proton antiporter [Novosphingobium cyanobacteriorum]MDF8333462.1 cation:proton antiporter [Novosphingobium cyanobacteriorum]